jgi:hypothetical protein
MALPIGDIRQKQVMQEIFGNTNQRTLKQCFAAANGVFNSNFVGNKDRLSNFKGYNHKPNTPDPNTSYLVSLRKASLSYACASGLDGDTQWHNGNESTPLEGDSVWVNQSHSQNVQNGYYKVFPQNGNPDYVINVNNGKVIQASLCN